MIASYCASSTECSDHSLKKYKKVFFFRISVVISAWCDKKIRKKINLSIFDSHRKIGQLENSFCRKMTRKTKKSYKNSKNFLKMFSSFLQNFCEFSSF